MNSLIDLVNELNKQLPKEYQFVLTMIHSTPPKEDGTYILEFLGWTNDIQKDYKVYPVNLYHLYNRHIQMRNVCRWINNKLFTSSLNQLLNDRNPLRTTELVRLRIATNLIFKLDFLTKEEKEEWMQHLHILYYNRHKAMSDYYLQRIAQLPF